MKPLCFLSPDITQARSVVRELRNDGIADKNIYVLARSGTDLDGLPDAGSESDDFLPAFARGLAFGGFAGLFLGLAVLLLRPTSLIASGGDVLLIGLMGASLGGLLTGIAGAAFPSSHLQAFEPDLDAGKILIMVDVRKDRRDHVSSLVRRAHPETELAGMEPRAPLIP
ncbi:MAG: hypothetical protein WD078_11445 [Woeseia sp.]